MFHISWFPSSINFTACFVLITIWYSKQNSGPISGRYHGHHASLCLSYETIEGESTSISPYMCLDTTFGRSMDPRYCFTENFTSYYCLIVYTYIIVRNTHLSRIPYPGSLWGEFFLLYYLIIIIILTIVW